MKRDERRDAGASIRFERELEAFSVDVVPDRRRVVVVPHGEIDIATVDRLAAEIEQLVGRGFETVVIDLPIPVDRAVDDHPSDARCDGETKIAARSTVSGL